MSRGLVKKNQDIAHSEYLFWKTLENVENGISINGETFNNLRYADDTVVPADPAQSIQRLIDRIAITSDKYGMRIKYC